jgi:hypothetical protein
MPQSRLHSFVADFGVYLFCIVGVLASRWVPTFRARQSIPIADLGWGELVFAAAIAFMVTFGFDMEGEPEGRRAAFKRRAAFALAQGFMWDTIVGGGNG